MDSPPRRAAPGRLSDRVYYWRRRAVVLVALVVVIALVVAIVSAIRGRSTTAAPGTTTSVEITETSATPTATDLPATPTPSASVSPSATSAAPTSAAATSAAAPTECVPNLLSLAVTGPRTVAATAKADLAVTLTNTGQVACVIVFDARFVLRVVSGSDEIWSTADCAAWMATGTQTVQPAAAVDWKTTWDRHRSQKECKVVPTTLKGGTYVANAMYTGAATAQWSMNLTG